MKIESYFFTSPFYPTLLIRIMVGGIFLSEGIQKFLFPEALGVGRFLRIGIPDARFMAQLVGGVEIVCAIFILLGLFGRLAAIPLLIDICVAFISTKIPILLGHAVWSFSLPELPRYGFWSMMHEARADFSMLLGLLFLLSIGRGSLAWNAVPFRRKRVL
jgi:putative oxidoreductase